jgi:hypothetical protein
MGTYGTEPFQGDNPEQFFDEVSTAFKRRDPKRHEMIMKPVHDVNRLPIIGRRRSLDGRYRIPSRSRGPQASDHYELGRAAIEIFLMSCDVLQLRSFSTSTAEDGRTLRRVADPMLIALLKMRSDKEWINSWGYARRGGVKETRQKLIASLGRQIRTLRKMMPYTLILVRASTRASHPFTPGWAVVQLPKRPR